MPLGTDDQKVNMGPKTQTKRWLTAAAVLALSTGAAACGGDDDASTAGNQGASDPVELRFAYVAGEKSPHGQLWAWWMDEVEKKTDGAVTFERYWDGTLMKADEMIEGLATDRVDVAQISPTAYGAEDFPITTVAEVPFITSNFPAVSAAMNTLMAEDGSPLHKEWADKKLEPLAWGIGASAPFVGEKQIKSVSDLKGLRLRSQGRTAQVMKAAGANPITLGAGEVYSSIDRGLLDGVYGIPFSFLASFKFPEIAKHYTELDGGISSINALAMSSEGWGKLSDEQREIMREVSDAIPAQAAKIEPAFDEESCAAIKEAGATLTAWPESETKKLADMSLATIEKQWAESATKAGADADAFMQSYRDTVKKATDDQFADFETGAQTCLGE